MSGTTCPTEANLIVNASGPIRFGGRRYSSLLIFALLLGLWHGAGFAAEKSAKAKKSEPPETDLFNGSNVVRIAITLSNEGLSTLRRNGWGWNGRNTRPTAKATIGDGHMLYTNVAIHLKGAAGSFRPLDDRPAFTLNFDKFAPEQTFHGLRKISLNNSVQDPSYLDEKICRELFHAAGVPVPRSDFAVVTLNGKMLGLYVLVEGFNKQFLRRYFKNVSGNLYDGGFCREVNEDLAVNSGDKPEDRSDIQRLLVAAGETSNKRSLDELAKVLDVDRFISFIAMEVLTVHWDGYALNRNNYRLYHDLDSDRMVFMPHGLDQMFATVPQGNTYLPILPHMGGYIANAVVGTSEGHDKYLKRFGELRTNVFNVQAITNRIRQLEARLRPVLAEVRGNRLASHQSAVNYLCARIVERAESLDQQLNARTKVTTFDSNGTLRLDNWKGRNNNGPGKFDIVAGPNGRKLLHVVADPGSPSSSWRTRITLKEGRYRLEGLAKTKSAGREPDAGATLRISGSPTRPTLHGDSDWTVLKFTFDVDEPERDVEIVCELRGTRGEAWFDSGMLKLRKIE